MVVPLSRASLGRLEDDPDVAGQVGLADRQGAQLDAAKRRL